MSTASGAAEPRDYVRATAQSSMAAFCDGHHSHGALAALSYRAHPCEKAKRHVIPIALSPSYSGQWARWSVRAPEDNGEA